VTDDVQAVINALHKKLDQILDAHEALRSTNRALAEENRKLKLENRKFRSETGKVKRQAYFREYYQRNKAKEATQ
jgi:regulator of replication initiation timing